MPKKNLFWLEKTHFLILSFIVLGISSVVTQVVFIRELAAGFYGNEFFTGWVLFAWLLWTGLGSSFGSSRPKKDVDLPRILALLLLSIAVLSFSQIILIRANYSVLRQAPGVLPDLLPSLIYSFFAIGPLCFLLGAQFPITVRLLSLSKNQTGPIRLLGRSYLFETAGFILGGAAFSYFLVHFNAFLAMDVVMSLNLILAGWIIFRGKTTMRRFALAVSLLVILLPAFKATSLNKITAQFRFPFETLLASENTLRGNLAVTRLKDQHNFYQNGMLLGSDRDSLASEYLVYFSMLAHSAPRKVLFLGTGFNGSLQEVLKHEPEQIIAIDLDPEFNYFAMPYLKDDLQELLADPRIQFWYGDSRAYFRESNEKFDVIIANFPDPLSILSDRNYTEEFFKQVNAHLAKGGVFATRLGFAANYVTPELERLGSSIYATLHEAFNDVKILPEDTVYFLASDGDLDFSDVKVMAARISERGLSPDFVTPDYLHYRFTNDRVQQVTTIFENSVWKVKNRDLKPLGYYFAFTRWLSQFHPWLSRILLRLSEIPFTAVVIVFLIFFAAPLLFQGSPEGNMKRLSLGAMRTAGFTIMSFEIILIYLFQVFLGDLYYRIAGLVAVLMAGVGIGAWVATVVKSRSLKQILTGLHLFAVLFYTALVVIIHNLHSALILPGFREFLFYGFGIISGAFVGMEFPFANDLYLREGKGDRVGAVYTADLFGSCLGALLTAGFLVPIWGVKKTLILLIAINALLVLFLFFRKNLRGKNV